MTDDIEPIDLPLYDVTLICRKCSNGFTGKSFIQRTYDNLGYGICDSCDAIATAPKLPNKPDLDLRPPRRVFGEDND